MELRSVRQRSEQEEFLQNSSHTEGQGWQFYLYRIQAEYQGGQQTEGHGQDTSRVNTNREQIELTPFHGKGAKRTSLIRYRKNQWSVHVCVEDRSKGPRRAASGKLTLNPVAESRRGKQNVRHLCRGWKRKAGRWP